MNPISWIEDKYKDITYFVRTEYEKSFLGMWIKEAKRRYEAGLGENRRASAQYTIAGLVTAGVALSGGAGLYGAVIGYAMVAKVAPTISSFIESGIKKLRAEAAVNDFIRKNPDFESGKSLQERKEMLMQLHLGLLDRHLTQDGLRTYQNMLGRDGKFNGKTIEELRLAAEVIGRDDFRSGGDKYRYVREQNAKLQAEQEKKRIKNEKEVWKNFGESLSEEERKDLMGDKSSWKEYGRSMSAEKRQEIMDKYQQRKSERFSSDKSSDFESDKSDFKFEPFHRERGSHSKLKPREYDNEHNNNFQREF